MWLNIKFILQFSFNSINKNLLRSFSLILSVILIISTTVTMLGWLEEAPKNAINAAFENRGYEVKISEIYYHEGGLETIQAYLETESIVESACIIHRSLFLYNLNNRNSNFSVLNPPVNESDFYISKEDLSNGAFFVPNEFLSHIQPMLQFESGSDISFGQDNTKVVISRRMLSLIEEKTNQSDLTLGSTINFSIATQFLPENHEELSDLNPLSSENFSILTIGAIYDRIPSQTQIAFGLDFYQETLGDGIFLSHELLSENFTSEIEANGFFPTLFVRLNRTYLSHLSIDQVIPQINYLTARIYQQGRYKIEIQTDEIHSLLNIFNKSFFVLILMLLPMLICAEIFYLALVPHLLNSRTDEFHYLRLRGTSDRKIYVIGGFEFVFLTFFGLIGGILGGAVLFDILLTTSNFLQVPYEFLYSRGRSLLETQSHIWLNGVIFVLALNFGYFLLLFKRIVKRLHQFDHERQSSRFLSTHQRMTSTILRLLIAGLVLYLAFTTLAPTILNELGASEISVQLIPLIAILVMALWVLFSFYIPQFCLRIIQSIFESLKIFKNPRRRITWVNLFRRRGQFISVLALITLTLSLFTFTIVYEETIKDNSNKNADYFIGGDIKLVTDDVSALNFSSKIVNISGIDHCVGFPCRTVTIARYSIVLIGIDPDSYNEISSVYPESIVDGPEPARFWHSLSENPLHSFIINNFMAEVFRWEIGSVTQVLGLLAGYGAEWNLSVTGILNSAPGVGSLYPGEYVAGVYSFGGYAFVHKDLLEAFGTTTANVFLLRINSTDVEQLSLINDQLQNLNEIRIILESSSVEKYQQNFFHLAGVQGLLTIDCLGAILVAILGVAVFYQYLVSERLQEFAIFQAFGATRRKISRLVLNESLFLTGIGIILGVITGNLFALGFLFASRTITISPNNIFLLELSISPIILGIGLIIVALVIFLTSLIPTIKIYGYEITHLLREL
ncbi:MAG: ABC transporter permease [Promethearchaeota archaeon]